MRLKLVAGKIENDIPGVMANICPGLGEKTFVAQINAGFGGTWDGTVKNLRFGWSSVGCYRDGSEASIQLEQMGAYLVDESDLQDLGNLPESEISLF